jgi:transcriptional regulator with XRE-family HTH domain
MSKSNMKKLGAAISRYRKAKGLTQPQLAEAVGVPKSTMLRIERGEFAAPSAEKLLRISRALDVDFEELFALAGYETPDPPALPVYLRRKFDLSDDAQARVERYIEQQIKKDKGGERG